MASTSSATKTAAAESRPAGGDRSGDPALELVAEFRDAPPSCVIVKHANPCGVATAATLEQAYAEAFACDTVSAFGGIIAVNRPLDEATARAITGIFTEVVVAPDADEAAIALFAAKKNLRLLLTGDLPPAAYTDPGFAQFLKSDGASD